MKNTERHEVWGILGGMGPLASAEFVHTIYQETIRGTDRDTPTVILLSNPAIPDRTEYLLNGQEDALLEVFSSSVGQLISAGATKIVIACGLETKIHGHTSTARIEVINPPRRKSIFSG